MFKISRLNDTAAASRHWKYYSFLAHLCYVLYYLHIYLWKSGFNIEFVIIGHVLPINSVDFNMSI